MITADEYSGKVFSSLAIESTWQINRASDRRKLEIKMKQESLTINYVKLLHTAIEEVHEKKP